LFIGIGNPEREPSRMARPVHKRQIRYDTHSPLGSGPGIGGFGVADRPQSLLLQQQPPDFAAGASTDG
tara:strand:+ start:369 stop:572 length:204 start_codon:yes stop_codon:yes gene_type:complete